MGFGISRWQSAAASAKHVTMSQTLEKRVDELEKRLGKLNARMEREPRLKDPWRTFAAFRDDPDFEEAVRLGREYREQQTCDKEIAGS